MILIIKRYKRQLLTLLLLFTLVMSGMILTAIDVVLTGMFFMIFALGVFIYAIAKYFFQKEGNSPNRFHKEILSFMVLSGLLCILGIGETNENYPVLMLVFLEVLIMILVFIYINFIKGGNGINKNDSVEGFLFPDWIFWFFLVFNGILLIVLEDSFKGSDQYGAAILFYIISFFLLVIRWIFHQIKSILQLKNEKTKTELIHLQSQVNPHFFFNMLNNLYGWVDRDAKKAKELILQLSDMMRYSIYDGQKEVVSLEEEIGYLKNYVELHKMRYQKKIDVSFHTNIQKADCEVLPLLFIILVENAFKHGVENLREGAFVNIDMLAQETQIKFTVENNFDPEHSISSNGIGLKNLQRRLELVYPKKHNLILSSKENIYKAELTINL